MMCIADETAAAAVNSDGQENQAPRSYQPPQVPSSAWNLPLNQAREIAYAALRLLEGLEVESWTASHRLEMRLQAFQQRILDAMQPQATSAAESAASTPAEARERVAAKRQARR